MSQLLRSWRCSSGETPVATTSGLSTTEIAQDLTAEEATRLITFLALAYEAFGRDPEYGRLWGNLNMTMCMWLYRRLVLPPVQHNPNARAMHLSRDQFKRCLMSLSADGHYLDWLVGRTMSERDRSPAYAHIRNIFAARLRADVPDMKPKLPQPAWSSTAGKVRRP